MSPEAWVAIIATIVTVAIAGISVAFYIGSKISKMELGQEILYGKLNLVIEHGLTQLKEKIDIRMDEVERRVSVLEGMINGKKNE